MTPAIARRLDKLESALLPPAGADALRLLSDDELEIAIMVLSRRAGSDPSFSPAEQQDAARRVAGIESSIRHMAAAQREPAYAARLAILMAAHPGFVPAVCCGYQHGAEPIHTGWEEQTDLRMPRIMERRAALRTRPDIAALIAEGARA